MSTKERVEKKAETSSGIEMKTVFGPSDVTSDYDHDVATPGQFPGPRSPHPEIYFSASGGPENFRCPTLFRTLRRRSVQ